MALVHVGAEVALVLEVVVVEVFAVIEAEDVEGAIVLVEEVVPEVVAEEEAEVVLVVERESSLSLTDIKVLRNTLIYFTLVLKSEM